MKNKIEENKRIYYLDIIKALAMFFVVYLHIIAYGGIQTINRNLGEYTIFSILALCDPLFFFVNGALLFNKKFDLKSHIKKIIKIIILIVFWCIISYIIIFFLKKGTIDILGSIKSVYNLVDDYNNHIWFLYGLVVIYIFFPLLKLAWDNNKKIFYFFFICLVIATIGNKFLVQIYNIILVAMGKTRIGINTNLLYKFNLMEGTNGWIIMYFMLGAICLEHKEKLVKYKKIAPIVLVINMFFTALYWNFTVNLSKNNFNYIIHSYDILFTAIGTICVFIMSMGYKENKKANYVLKLLGSNTLGIYLIHMIIINIVTNVLKVNINYNRFIALLWGIIIYIISLIISVGLKKIPIIRKAMFIGAPNKNK